MSNLPAKASDQLVVSGEMLPDVSSLDFFEPREVSVAVTDTRMVAKVSRDGVRFEITVRYFWPDVGTMPDGGTLNLNGDLTIFKEWTPVEFVRWLIRAGADFGKRRRWWRR